MDKIFINTAIKNPSILLEASVFVCIVLSGKKEKVIVGKL